jgi:outer membrane biogenesis lipoprotein LolB
MHRFRRSAALLLIIAMAALAGCSRTTSAPPAQAPSAQLRVGHHGGVSVVLTPLGAQQVGIQTTVAAPAHRGGQAVVPYSALLYQPDGSSVVYTVTGPLTYTLVAVNVASTQGNEIYLTGLAAGTAVVTVGGEELLGVQDGVGVQT